MRHLSIGFLTVLFFSFFNTASSQDLSNRGKEFWLGYGHNNLFQNGNGQNLVLYLSTEQAATVTVSINGTTWTRTYNIPANSVRQSDAIPKTGTDDARIQTEGLSSRGIHIESDVPIVAYAHQYGANSSGATMLMPVETFGYTYYSLNYTQQSNSTPAYSWFFIVASEDNTKVEITPSVQTSTGQPAGFTYSVNLNKGQIYNVFGQAAGLIGQDLTGSKIKSVAGTDNKCHPIGVFSGSSRMVICGSSGEVMQQQIFPATAWGTRYLTYSTVQTTNVNQANTNYYRVAVRDPSTVVKRNGVQLTGLLNNFYYEFSSNTGDYIEADKPVLVGQYVPSQQACSVYTGDGDPEMFFLSPLEQAINKAIFYATGNQSIQTNYVSIIVKSAGTSSLKIDGALNSWNSNIVHPSNSAYRVITKLLTNNAQHSIECDSNFTAITYGFSMFESYGYNAGTLVNNLDAVTTIQNTLSQVGGTNSYTCPNSPFQFSIKLSYKPTQMVWKFSQVSKISPNADTTLNNPVAADSSIINGRTYYQYNLPNSYRLSDTGTFNIPITIFSPSIDNCNNSVDVIYPLKVSAPPKADFTFNYTGCKSDTAYLFGNYIPGPFTITRYRWTFDNGQTDTVQNTKIVFPTQGSHPVKLSVIAANGCVGDTTKQVFTAPPPLATFGMTPPQSCGPATVTFTDTSSYSGGAITNWYWDFGNGQILNATTNASQTQTYNTPGSYLIQHFAQSGSCMGDTTKKILNIYANPVSDFSFTIGCLQDSTVQFQNASSVSDGQPLVYAWDFGDPNANAGNPNTSSAKDPTHRYAQYGTYQVKLTVTTPSGCTATITKPYTVTGFAAPINYLVENESSLCVQSQVKLTNQMNIASDSVYRIDIYWDFANQPTVAQTDNTPTPNEIYLHQYPNFTTPITKTVTIKWVVYSKGGCISEKTKDITLNATPAISFPALTNICENAGIVSVSKATITNGVTGNGVYSGPGTDAAGNFNPAVAGVGTHAIKYVFTTAAGCKDSASTNITVYAKPVVKWGYSMLCDSTRFADSSTIASGSIASWHWNFGNGNTSTRNTKTPFNYLYTTAGTFNASLHVISDNGCSSDTSVKPITINPLPVPAFTVANENALCSKNTVVLTNTTVPGADTVKRIDIYWDFANQPALVDVDNSPAINKQYSHLYPSFTTPATKAVAIRYVVYSRNGCTTEITKTITLHALPVLSFSTLNGVCVNAGATSVALASVTNGVVGNGVYSGTGVSANGSFDPAVAGPGLTTVKYIFASNGGCIDSISKTINVFPKPVAKWGFTSACINDSTTFSDTSTISSGAIVSRQWNFGDGTNTTRTNALSFKKLYSNYGTYNVTMYAVSDSGCQSDPVTKSVIVHALPVPDFTLPASACLPNASITFTNTSSLPNGSASSLSYAWNFGDPNATAGNPNTSANTNPTHIYTDSAQYTIRLTATSAAGCVKDTIKTFNAFFKRPIAEFAVSAAAICQGTETVFIDTSVAPGSSISKWQWSFGDGTSSAIKNPKKTYASPGNFSIKLTVTTPEGCTDDTIQTVKVYLQPKVDAGPTLLVAEGSSVQLQPVVNDTSLQFLWTPSIYLNNDTLLRPTAILPQFSTTYMLTATGEGNCTASDTMRVTVLKNLNIPNAFSPNGDGINDNWDVPYLYDYPGNVVEIFNRYGQRVHRIVNFTRPWDGTVNGKPLPVGVYYYVIDLKQPGYSLISGHITLLK